MVQGEPGAPGPVLGRVDTRSTEVVEGVYRVQDCDLTQGRLQWFIGGQLNVSGEQWLDEHSGCTHPRTHPHG